MANVIEVIIRGRDQLSGEFKKATDNVKKINTNLLAVGAAAGAMSAAIILPIRKALTETITFGDQIGKMAKQTGMGAESLSTLGFAAERSGANMAALTAGLRRMSKAVSDADEGLAESQRTFENLGINIYTAGGSLKSMEDLLLESADAFSKMTDDTKMAALAQELFGRGGLQLLPMLKEGSAGIKELQARARELGIELSGPQAEAWERIQDGVTDMQTSFKGLKMQIAEALAPAFEALVGKITNIVTAVIGWMKEHPGLTGAILKTALVIAGAGGLLAAITAIIAIAGPLSAAFTLMFGPIGLIIMGVAGLTYAIYKFRNEIYEGLLIALRKVVEGLETFLGWINDVLKVLGVDWLDGAVEGLRRFQDELKFTEDSIESMWDSFSGGAARAGTGAGGGWGEEPGKPGRGKTRIDIFSPDIWGPREPRPPTGLRKAHGRTDVTMGDMILGVTPEQQEVTITKWDELMTKIYEVAHSNFINLEAGLTNVFDNVADGFGAAMTNMALMGRTFADSFRNTFKSLIASLMGELMSLIAKLIFAATLKAFLFGGGIPTVPSTPSMPGGYFPTTLTPTFRSGGSSLGGGMNIIIQTLDASSLREELRHGELGRELRLALGGA